METGLALTNTQDIGGLVKFAEYIDEDPYGILAKMGIAQALGFHPALYTDVIYIMDKGGKKTFGVSSKACGALIQKHPKYDYTVVVREDDRCEIKFTKKSELTGEVESYTHKMTAEYAERAGWTSQNTWNWKKYPAQMLFYRCLMEGTRTFCPEVLGGANAYSIDEMPGAKIVDGVYTDITPVEIPEERVEAVVAPKVIEVIPPEPVVDEKTLRAVAWCERYIRDEYVGDEEMAADTLARAANRVVGEGSIDAEFWAGLSNHDRARYVVCHHNDEPFTKTATVEVDEF